MAFITIVAVGFCLPRVGDATRRNANIKRVDHHGPSNSVMPMTFANESNDIVNIHSGDLMNLPEAQDVKDWTNTQKANCELWIKQEGESDRFKAELLKEITLVGFSPDPPAYNPHLATFSHPENPTQYLQDYITNRGPLLFPGQQHLIVVLGPAAVGKSSMLAYAMRHPPQGWQRRKDKNGNRVKADGRLMPKFPAVSYDGANYRDVSHWWRVFAVEGRTTGFFHLFKTITRKLYQDFIDNIIEAYEPATIIRPDTAVDHDKTKALIKKYEAQGYNPVFLAIHGNVDDVAKMGQRRAEGSGKAYEPYGYSFALRAVKKLYDIFPESAYPWAFYHNSYKPTEGPQEMFWEEFQKLIEPEVTMGKMVTAGWNKVVNGKDGV